MKHAHYDTNGRILGYYDNTIHKSIPQPSIELTDDEWRDCIDNNGQRRVNVEASKLEMLPPAPTLERAESLARSRVNTARLAAESTPVEVDGVLWQGGYNDVQRLDGARRLAIEAGLADVTFYDANNVGHTMAIADATTLVIQLGARVQQLIAAKQTAYQQIDAIIADESLGDEEKIAALEAVA